MPADAPRPQQSSTTTVATTAAGGMATATAAEPGVPRWGDPLESIPMDRHMRLLQLAARQRVWVASAPDGQRDLATSAFQGERLNGAEVFFLAAESLAYDREITMQEAAWCLRAADGDNPDTWIALPFLHLEGVVLHYAHLEHAALWQASLTGADLRQAYLEGADLRRAHLEGAVLGRAHLEGAILRRAYLEGAFLGYAMFDAKTQLANVILGSRRSTLARLLRRKSNYGDASLGDIRWEGPPDLTRVRWESLQRLGDEEGIGWRSPAINETERDHRRVVRAYRQVAAQLRAQGLSEEADRFAERAQVRRRKQTFRQMLEDWRRPWRLPGDLLRWLFSWFLAVLAGYGYHPGRSVFWYLATIGGFAAAYYQVTRGMVPFGLPSQSSIPALTWYEACILSISSFHGRGFFQPVESLGDPVAAFAAVEAVIGLVIEISFIATFTQRFFGTK